MNQRDVIITAFACGGKMKCKQEAQKFKEPPIILNASDLEISKKLSVLDAILKRKISPRRICLVGYSVAGSTWLENALKKDQEKFDTVIVLDGPISAKRHWIDFADQSGKGGCASHKLWMAHTLYKGAGAPSKTCAKLLRRVSGSTTLDVPDYLAKVVLEKTISIYSKTENPKYKFYHNDPLLEINSIGNVVEFVYSGTQHQDSLYLSQYVQPRLWRWLRETWDNPETGIFWTPKENSK